MLKTQLFWVFILCAFITGAAYSQPVLTTTSSGAAIIVAPVPLAPTQALSGAQGTIPSSTIFPSVYGWKKKVILLIIINIAAALIVCLPVYRYRYRLVDLLRRSSVSRATILSIDPTLAIVLSILASLFALFQPATYQSNSGWLFIGGALWSVTMWAYISLKVTGEFAKNKDQEEIAGLRNTLNNTAAKAKLLSVQRDSETRLVSFIGTIVDKKMERLMAAVRTGSIKTAADFAKALNPTEQLTSIIMATHSVISGMLNSGYRLRIGVYMRSQRDPQNLRIAFSWDGTRTDCFSKRQGDYWRLDDPTGTKSAVCSCFHKSDGFILIPSCPEAVKERTFFYFTPDQERYLKSMVIMRHNMREGLHTDAVVASLDTDQEFFFNKDREDEMRKLLSEMMRRFEFELCTLDAVKKSEG